MNVRAARSASEPPRLGADVRGRRSLRLRLTAVYTLLFLVSGTALLGVTYLLVEHATGRTLTYVSPDGRYSLSLRGPDAADAPEGSATEGPTSQITGPASESPAPADPDELRALASQQHTSSMHQLAIQGVIALALVTAGSAALGWFVAGRVLAPLRTITRTVREISATSLHRRLALDGPQDELTELGDTFDALLDRLESSFDAQRQFVANASHELRTPLARQRTIGQVALQDPDASACALRDAHERILRAGREQEQLIEALLELARGQAALGRRSVVDLADLAGNAVSERRPSSDGPRVTTRLDPAPVAGDARLLRRLVQNLVDNAVRYTPAVGRVQVSTATEDDDAVLSVVNSGPHLTTAQVAGLRQPFHRGTARRTGRDQGVGLGLPLVEAIARSHGASLELRPGAGGGLVARVRLARAAPDDEHGVAVRPEDARPVSSPDGRPAPAPAPRRA